jgi:phosphoglycerate kinase
VADDDLILDIGPETAAAWRAQLNVGGTIVWNGPVGVFEFAAFENGTRALRRPLRSRRPSALPAAGDTWPPLPNMASKTSGLYLNRRGRFPRSTGRATLPAFEILEKRAAPNA